MPAVLDPHREGGELVAALAVIRETGQAPPTRAGERDRLNDRLKGSNEFRKAFQRQQVVH